MPLNVPHKTFTVGKVLGKDQMIKVFNFKSHKTEYGLSDAIKRDLVEYQVQKIPNSFFEDKATNSNTTNVLAPSL